MKKFIFFPHFHLAKLLLVFLLALPSIVLGQDTASIQQQLQKFKSGPQKVEFLLKQMEENMHADPTTVLHYADLADAYLQGLDALVLQLEVDRMRALAFREQGEYEKATKFLENSLEKISISDTSRYFKAIQAKIYINLASLYRRISDTQKALALNIQAAQIVDTLMEHYPNKVEYLQIHALAMSGLGMIHGVLDNHSISNSYFRKALVANQKLENQEQITFAFFNLGTNYFKIDQYDSAEVYWSKGIPYIDTLNQVTLLQAFYYNLGALKSKEKRWEEAVDYYNKAIYQVKKSGNQEELARSYESLASMYIEKGDYKMAEKEAKMALSLVKDRLETKVRIHEDLADIYENTGQLQEALTYYKQYISLQDSLTNVEKNKAIAEMDAKYQNDKQQQELKLQHQQIELLNQDNKIKLLSRNILALAFVLLLLAGFFVVRTKNLKVRRKQEQLEHSRALLTTQKENARLREQKLQQDLDHRNQQLTSYTVNFIQKNELLDELKEQVDLLQKQKQWTAHDFRPLKQRIQRHVSIDQDWEHFKLHFEHVHPGFFRNLTDAFPDLGPSDMKLCALIRLKMNIKESALVLGISPDSVKTARHRLRKKMDLDSEDVILDILMQVEKGIFERGLLLMN